MGRKDKIPATRAIRVLQKHSAAFTAHPYRYVPQGGTAVSAQELGVQEHEVIKTLVMEDSDGTPLIILMHGDAEVSTKELARSVGTKSVTPCRPETAQRHSGYQVGGTSPFGTRKKMRVYMESTILELDRIFINGGKRGLLVELSPHDLQSILQPLPVHVAIY